MIGLRKQVIGIDIGGKLTRTGIVTDRIELIGLETRDSRDVFAGDSAIQGLADHLKAYMKDHNLHTDEISAISIGFPSTLDRGRRVVLSTPYMEYLDDNLQVADELEREFGIPVFLDRDVNLSMLFDIYKKNLPKQGIVAGFYIGTGIGNAIYIDGRLITGEHGVAGELGHIPVMDKKDRCGCGNEGCIELYAAGGYLDRVCKESFPDTPVSEIFEKHGDDPKVEKYIEYAALPIASEINILDPSYIIIGGAVLQMKEFPKKKLEQEIHRFSRKPFPEQDLIVIYADPNPENTVIGAGLHAFHELEV